MRTPQQQQQEQQQHQQQQRQQCAGQQQHSSAYLQHQYVHQQAQQRAHAYQQQHARTQQRRAAPASGNRRQRSDAGVPRGSRAMPDANDRQQQARRVNVNYQAAYAAAYQHREDQDDLQHTSPAWEQVQQQLRALQQQVQTTQQQFAAEHAAQAGQARPSDWQRHREDGFKHQRAAAPALACYVLEQQAAPPADSSCSVCQQANCTVR
eukprot:GHRQ01023180.1.p2 GENE.GHRQ01023180.1~~GHRQ01023180.1.p2  ORF type:complete len:208 (+),score=96.71 GHRQ01023180.1:35-658(+)